MREDRCAWAVAPLPVFDQNPGGQLPVALVGQEVVLEQSVMGRILLFAECHRPAAACVELKAVRRAFGARETQFKCKTFWARTEGRRQVSAPTPG
jgi:hypothetical protein